ncbi:hypothetical protein FQA39_LY12302 [Lamprigera yunnana]|nr:hypothetical protein FQA39_LY12302 [Lamprigera yunnana]
MNHAIQLDTNEEIEDVDLRMEKVMEVLIKDPHLKSADELFKAKYVDKIVRMAAGERIVIAAYGEDKGEKSLTFLRFTNFTKLVTMNRFNLATLPPSTSAAAGVHQDAYNYGSGVKIAPVLDEGKSSGGHDFVKMQKKIKKQDALAQLILTIALNENNVEITATYKS